MNKQKRMFHIVDRLPANCQQLVRDFASGWTPTPSARALHDFWRLWPWVVEMQAMMTPELSLPAVYIYHHADVAGTHECMKCHDCITQRLWNIRVRYQPELLDLLWL